MLAKLSKLAQAFNLLRKDVSALKGDVQRIDKVRPIVTEGKRGKDGVSPKVEDIVKLTLAQIPAPKDGKSPDPKAIVADVLAIMPKPVPGRDAPQVNVSDVAAIVLAKIPKPKDGHNGPDLETVVRRVKAQVQDGKNGERGVRGPKGEKGKNGVSVTDVKLTKNELFVFLGGKKHSAGKIRLPAATAPFRPGNDGGGGSARHDIPEELKNVIKVNNLLNIPKQDATTWTAEAGIEYKFGAFVSTDKECIQEFGSVISGNSPFNKIYEYTGAGTAFRSLNASLTLENFGFDVPNGTIFDAKGSGIKQLRNVICESCKHFGIIEASGGPTGGSLLIDNSGVFDIKTTGLVLNDAFIIFGINELFLATTNPAVKLIDYTTATFEDFEITNLELRGPIGAEGLVGAANSANMAAGTVGTIRDSTLGLPGTITPLGGGLDPDDTGFKYSGTPAVISSATIGHTYVTTPALTDIVDGTDVQIAGTFAQGSESSQSASSVTGCITTLNRTEQRGTAVVNVDMSKASGAAADYLVKIRKKPSGAGSFVDVDGAFSTTTLAGGGSDSVPIKAPVRYKDGDEFIVTVRGVGTNEDVTATTTGFTIN